MKINSCIIRIGYLLSWVLSQAQLYLRAIQKGVAFSYNKEYVAEFIGIRMKRAGGGTGAISEGRKQDDFSISSGFDLVLYYLGLYVFEKDA